MHSLLFLLLLLFLIPAVLVLAGFVLLLFLPAFVFAHSMVTLLFVPQQIWAIARDRTTRRTHACEHATVNVIESKFGPQPQMGGVATHTGFYIWGAEAFHPNILIAAAQEALQRMKSGEGELALHPRCGTSLAVARLVFASVFIGGLIAIGYFSFTALLVALVLSWLLGRPVGLWVQRHFTTSSDVDELRIQAVTWTDRPQLGPGQFLPLSRGAYFFHAG